MAEMTLSEAQLQLTTINAAIQDIISGKRITQLRIGSGDFQRLYHYSEITIESLTTLRSEIRNIINTLTPDVKPVFRTNATIPLVVHK
jgi:hypothetical protein